MTTRVHERGRHATLSLPSCLPNLVGPRLSLLAGPLRGFRWLHLEQIGDNVVKGKAIERQGLDVSVSDCFHVPSLRSVLAIRATHVANSTDSKADGRDCGGSGRKGRVVRSPSALGSVDLLPDWVCWRQFAIILGHLADLL